MKNIATQLSELFSKQLQEISRGCSGMALAHSRRPSMAGYGDTAKAMSPIVRRESHRVIRSAANTAMSQARTSSNVSLVMQLRKLSYK